MKKLLLYLLLLPLFTSGQYGGNLQAYQVKVASYGATQWALLSLPDDYTSTAESYPLIIFLHGQGQTGTTAQDLMKQITDGLPKVMSGGAKIEAVNPLDKKLYKFIVIAPQHHNWTTGPEAIDYMLSDLPKKFRIDTNRIYLTGLSAGGQGIIHAIGNKQTLTNKVAAVVVMSPSAPADEVVKNLKFVSESKTGAWFFSGKNDPTFTNNAIRYADSIRKYNPTNVLLTIYPGGHCCWPTYYSPDYKENGYNIYSWMLTYKRGGKGEPPAPEPLKYIQILHEPAKVRKIIILDLDGTWHEYDSTSYTSGSVKMSTR